MKVLYLSGATGADFQCDMAFHGLRTILGADCVDVNKLTYMYQGEPYPPFYTVYGLLPDIPVDRENIVEKIQNRFFDAVIYGSIQRNQEHFTLVKALYPRERIALIDGEDHPDLCGMLGHGWYFKRELWVNDETIFPIEFCIPKEKIRAIDLSRKNRLMAECDPRDRTTYKFYSNEKGYYDQYSDSYFGFTMKKGGWDCCRHYEIIAAGCLPYFQGIERCPVRTLTWMPKDILLEARALADAATFHEPTWLGLMARIQDALRGHLTTEACAQRILEQLDD